MSHEDKWNDFVNQIFWIGLYGRTPRPCFQKVLTPTDISKNYLTVLDWWAKTAFPLLDYVEGHNPIHPAKTRQDIKFPFIMEDIDQNRFHMVYRRQMSEDLVNDKGKVVRKGKAKSYIQGMWADYTVEFFQLLGQKDEGGKHNCVLKETG